MFTQVANDIHLGPKQSDAWLLLHDQEHTEVFFGGGAGPGKSWLGCLWEIHGAIHHKGSRGLIARNSYEDLRKTTILTFFEVCSLLGYREGDHYRYNAQEHTVYWVTGSLTFFDYLQFRPSDPDFNRLGSREYTRVFVDEAPECEERAIDILATRIRYKLSEFKLAGKMLLTGNPGEHWLKFRFVFDKSGKEVELPEHRSRVLTTIEDNPDPEFRAMYIVRLEQLSDPYDRSRLRYGDWMATPRTGMEFFHAFSTKDHIQSIPYDPAKAIHATLDFNAAPYMTLLAAQIWRNTDNRWRVHFLKEYCPSHPLNNTRAVCEQFKTDLVSGCYAGHKAGVFVYGDYSGKKSDPMATATERHNYDALQSILHKWLAGNWDRVIPNPPHVVIRDFMNDCYSRKLPIDITFDPSMTNTIRDMSHLKQGADGGILKEYETDRKTGVKFEKMGHCAQAHYYLVRSAFRDLYNEHAKAA